MIVLRYLLLASSLLPVALPNPAAQPQASGESYRIDYPRYFFQSREAERTAREPLPFISWAAAFSTSLRNSFADVACEKSTSLISTL